MEIKHIAAIIDRFMALFVDGEVHQLKVSHPADDDGLWFFRRRSQKMELQLESSSGDFPFLIESSSHDRRFVAHTLEEAIEVIRLEFGAE